MKLNLMNKRGGIQTIIIMIIILFGIALAAIIFSKVFLDVTGELKTCDEFSNNTIDTIEAAEMRTVPLLDYMIFFSLIALMVGLIISSIYLNVHPAVVMVLIIALLVAVFFAGQIANVFSDITADDQLSATAGEFELTNVVLGEYFPLIILVVGIIVIIILYGKSRRVGEVEV